MTKEVPHILIVEDDVQLTIFIQTVLEREGYRVKTVYNGSEGLQEVFRNNYSLLLLDLNLPEANGILICQKVREVSDMPIIIFTAQNKLQDKVDGLDAGANDYITKPVEVAELLARVRAHLRTKNNIRYSNFPYPDDNKKTYLFKDLSLDIETREVKRNSQLVHLSPKEYEILLCFMKNSYKTLTKQQIFEEVWQYKFNSSDKRVVDEHINQLRKKIHKPEAVRLLHTVYGIGYILK